MCDFDVVPLYHEELREALDESPGGNGVVDSYFFVFNRSLGHFERLNEKPRMYLWLSIDDFFLCVVDAAP